MQIISIEEDDMLKYIFDVAVLFWLWSNSTIMLLGFNPKVN